jgi:hypothetical protein
MAFSIMGLKQTLFCIEFVMSILLVIKMIASLAHDKFTYMSEWEKFVICP